MCLTQHLLLWQHLKKWDRPGHVVYCNIVDCQRMEILNKLSTKKYPRHSPVCTNKSCSSLNSSLVFSANRASHVMVIFLRPLSTKTYKKETIRNAFVLPYVFHQKHHFVFSLVEVREIPQTPLNIFNRVCIQRWKWCADEWWRLLQGLVRTVHVRAIELVKTIYSPASGWCEGLYETETITC